MSRFYKFSIFAVLLAIAVGVGIIAIIPALMLGGGAMMVDDAHRRVLEDKADAAKPRLIAGKDSYVFGHCEFSILSAKIANGKLTIKVEIKVNSNQKKLDLLTPTYWNEGIKIVDEFGNNYTLERRENYLQTVLLGKPHVESWNIEAPIPAAKSILLDFPSTIIDGNRNKLMRFEVPIEFITR